MRWRACTPWAFRRADAAPNFPALSHSAPSVAWYAAFGLRHLVDIASKALSPAVNDPYTAVQAIDHLAIVLAALAARPLGSTVLVAGPSGSVAAPALEFSGFLDLACAQIRRYGSSEPMVSRTLVGMLGAAADTLAVDAGGRRDAIAGPPRPIPEAARHQPAPPAPP